MGLPIAAVQVGIADRVATMEHPAVTHIDAHMRNTRCVIGADKEHQITGAGAARPGADVIKALRPQPPEAPAALIVDVADEAGAVKGRGRAAAAPHIGKTEILFRFFQNGGKGFIIQIGLRDFVLRRTVGDVFPDIRDIREAHKKDSESAPQTTVADELKENLEAVENFKGSRDEKLVVLYCKQLGINYKNLSDEEFRWLIRILKKSKKMGTPISQRKKR